MSFVSNMLSGDKGNGWQAKAAPIQNAATVGQATDAYNNAQSGLTQQQAFVNALGAQNGIQNQSNVYNQLAGMAAGTGPNPAQAALQQATGANVANQAALMAGQRGSSANAGLMARQAAQQGANIQQQAVGQGATMQAQQSQAAINSMAGIAGQQVGQQANAITGYNQAAQAEQGQLLGAIANQNNANVAMQSNMNNNNATIANTNAQAQNKMGSGMLGSLGKVAAVAAAPATGGMSLAALPAMGANGGMVGYADGGAVPPLPVYSPAPMTGPQSSVGQFLGGYAPPAQVMAPMASGGAQVTDGSYLNDSGGGAPKPPGGAPAAMDSTQLAGATGATDLASAAPAVMMAAQGGAVDKLRASKKPVVGEKLAAKGEKVPGKAKVKGNSYANDTVKALLSPGEVVIPLNVMQSSNPPAEAAKFVAAVLARKGMK